MNEIRCTAGQAIKPTDCERHNEHYWCEWCVGYFGVPHNGRCHTAEVRSDFHIVGIGSPSPGQCACSYCRTWRNDGYRVAEEMWRGLPLPLAPRPSNQL